MADLEPTFHLIEGASIVLKITKRGIFKQAKLYRNGVHVFAAHGGGFVRVHRLGTSCPDIGWAAHSLENARFDSLSYMTVPNK